ncbi:hypothetical protein GQ600_10041 [Phytophthora cactorum]|nr:hypothetical protein GQ600_10041 [Phytophthora cactorum]
MLDGALDGASGFKGSIVPGLSSAKARVVNALQKNDKVNLEHRPALVHRAIAKAKASMADGDGNYDKLPAFLRTWFTSELSTDSLGRFIVHFYLSDHWLPLRITGCLLHGICVLLIGKDGEWTNIPVAIAFIHKETAENFEWFFANCAVAGIKLHDRANFSDRGKQRDAQLRLAKIGIHVQLNESVAIAETWKNANSYGSACPLFGGRTTSAVEGQNNALLLSSVRDSHVFDALSSSAMLRLRRFQQKRNPHKRG